MATTLVADDPLFGLLAYGGTLKDAGARLEVVPRDGLRQRFGAILPAGATLRKLRVEFDRDGFAADAPIAFDRALGRVAFLIENRTADAHRTGLRLSLPPGERYQLRVAGRPVPLQPTGNFDYPFRAEFDISGANTPAELARR
jgi:hypothetical protein